jgi:DNA-binding FadR family transcriptional regulator
VQRSSTRAKIDQALAALQVWIGSAESAHGTQIPTERHLAETLRLPRHAVRAALLEVERAGLIERQVGRGTFVTGPRQRKTAAANAQDRVGFGLSALLEARLAFEPVLMRLAAAHATPASLATLESCLDDMGTAQTLAEIETAKAEFGLAIARAAGNPVIEAMAEPLAAAWRDWAQAGGTSLPVPPEQRAEAVGWAAAILAALRALDPSAAENLTRQVIRKMLNRFSLLAQLDQQAGASMSGEE